MNGDMTGSQCFICGVGTYVEKYISDDMDGVLHCTNCDHKVVRYWKPPSECIACGSESTFLYHAVNSEKVMNGETFNVSHRAYCCRDCNFSFLGPNEIEEAIEATKYLYKIKHEN